jgi:hypothetical protein
MGLFKSKPKLSTEECCRQFYDQNIFQATVAGRDFWADFLDTISNYVAEADQSFSQIDPKVLRQEMTALRMELFGLAWLLRFKRHNLAVAQSFFTRDYLGQKRKIPIWEIMGEYNQAIARSATADSNGKPMGGRTGRGRSAYVNTMREGLFEEWAKNNIRDGGVTKEVEENAKCIARVCNHIGADVKRADDVTIRLLTARLADRLGCDINLKSEALSRLMASVFGFYEGAKEYLKSVDVLE